MYSSPGSVAKWRAACVAAAGLIAALGCTAMLAGCFTTMPVASGLANDYRLRHPIAIKEGVRTVELFIGSKRGGLTPDQRADVTAFAGTWRRRGDRRHSDRAAGRDAQRDRRGARRARGSRNSFRSARAAECRRSAPVRAGRSQQDPHRAAQLSDHDGRSRTVWTLAARPRPDSRPRAQREHPVLEPGLRDRSATSPPWSTTRPTWFSRAARCRPTPAAAPQCSTSTAAAKAPRPSTPTPKSSPRSATWANDHIQLPRG